MNRLQARLLKCEVRVVFMTWFRRRRLWRMLRTLAPGIFAPGGGAGPMQSAYGQFVSILYASMVIVFEENGPHVQIERSASVELPMPHAQVVDHHARWQS